MKILLFGSLAAMLLLSLSHGQDQAALVVDGDDGDVAVPVKLQALRELKRSLQNDDINDDGNLQMALRGLDDGSDDDNSPDKQMALRGLEDGDDDDNTKQVALRQLDNDVADQDSANAVGDTAPKKRFFGSLVGTATRFIRFRRFRFRRRRYTSRSYRSYRPYRSYRSYRYQRPSC